jgi:hypothetical protein
VHTKIRRLLFAFLALALLVGTSMAIVPMQQMRSRYDLSNEPVKGISPELAMATQVLGWARGIIIDVVWIRMEALKQQGRFFELVQLADWACKLAPRIPEVWDIQSWNMAYNVSSQVDWLVDRWAWVRSGIELLRDEGIPANPNAVDLYFSLAFMIQHKIGQEDDYAHMFYKRELAREMHVLFGGGGSRETLRKFIEAPETREELFSDDDVRRFVNDCAQYGFDIVGNFFKLFRDRENVREEVRKIVEQPFNRQALDKVAAFARARELKEEYSMDPQYMLTLMDRYGPFDWRSPFPHAIYWASRGLEKLAAREDRLYRAVNEFGLPEPYAREELDEHYGDREKMYEYERVQLERVIYASLQNLVAHGRMLCDSEGNVLYTWGTDYRFADAALKFFQRALETWGPRYTTGVISAYGNFLIRGVVEFHFMGDNEKSREYFELLKDEFPEKIGKWTYDAFLENQLEDYTASMTFSQARRMTYGFLVRSLLYRGYGESDKAAAIEQEARVFAARFDPEEHDNLRGRIRFDEIKQAAIVDLLTGRIGKIPEEARANLRSQLEADVGKDKVKQMLEEVEGMDKAPIEMEDIDERFMKDPTVKPQPSYR